MGSTRLPGKVLKKIDGKNLLDYHFERLGKSGHEIYLATTNLDSDDILCTHAKNIGIKYYRGNENDVLSRYAELALKNKLDHVVRVTSDCPLIDGELISDAIDLYLKNISKGERVFLSNTIERTFPRGFDFEIFSAKLLLEAHAKATELSDREHVTPYIWKGKIKETNIIQYRHHVDKSHYRLTVDTNEDLDLIRLLLEKYSCETLSAGEIIEVMDKNPQLYEINKHVEQKQIGK